MQGYIILGVVIGLPLVLGLAFRVNTSFLFFSMLAGELLARYFGDDTELVGRLFVRSQEVLAYSELVLLVLPVILTAIFLRKTLSKGKVLVYIIPYALTGFILAAFALPILPEALQHQVRGVEPGRRLLEGSEAIVGIVVLLQLIALWIINRSHEHKGKHK